MTLSTISKPASPRPLFSGLFGEVEPTPHATQEPGMDCARFEALFAEACAEAQAKGKAPTRLARKN